MKTHTVTYPLAWFTGFMLGLLTLSVGCAGRQPLAIPAMPPPPPAEAFENQNAERVAAYEENSLYTASSGMSGLFHDTKARRPGDIVTVKIEESSKATNMANTKTARDSSLSAGIETMMGIASMQPMLPFRAQRALPGTLIL